VAEISAHRQLCSNRQSPEPVFEKEEDTGQRRHYKCVVVPHYKRRKTKETIVHSYITDNFFKTIESVVTD